MTKQELISQCLEISDQILTSFMEEAQHLIRSGAVDHDNFDKEDWMLAKAVSHAALNKIAGDWRPLSDPGKTITENLEHF